MTPKQLRFVSEYLVDLNATQAAVRAGYSLRTAKAIGHENLTKPDVAAAIAAAQTTRAEATGITADRVLAELELLAFSNIEHYVVNDEGVLTLAEGAPAGAMKAVQSVKRKFKARGSGDALEITREVEIKLWDKPGPLKLAGNHVGILKDKLTVEVGPIPAFRLVKAADPAD